VAHVRSLWQEVLSVLRQGADLFPTTVDRRELLNSLSSAARPALWVSSLEKGRPL
jgi:hypothetical protein